MDPMQYGLKAVDFGRPCTATTGLDRRGFLGASLAGGFALAAGPAAASTIITDTEGLTAGEITIRTDDGEIPAYRAMPESDLSSSVRIRRRASRWMYSSAPA